MLLVASAAWAQSRNITGIVFDTDGKSPLVGATVILKGTATGTISNADGTYTIHVGSDKGRGDFIRDCARFQCSR